MSLQKGKNQFRTGRNCESCVLNCETLHSFLSADRAAPPADPVILCIGTDRIIGDSLGPMVGSMLEREAGGSLPVYGTLRQPVHALNLQQVIEQIKKKHPDCMIIAVDASLGCRHEVGSVYVRSGGLHPGAGVSKILPSAGDISITGIAAPDSRQPYLALQTTRLSTIAAMAETICSCIMRVCVRNI